jgi:hypothetical protein
VYIYTVIFLTPPGRDRIVGGQASIMTLTHSTVKYLLKFSKKLYDRTVFLLAKGDLDCARQQKSILRQQAKPVKQVGSFILKRVIGDISFDLL